MTFFLSIFNIENDFGIYISIKVQLLCSIGVNWVFQKKKNNNQFPVPVPRANSLPHLQSSALSLWALLLQPLETECEAS